MFYSLLRVARRKLSLLFGEFSLSGKANFLACSAIHRGSKDNVTVSIKTVDRNSKETVWVGVFDGHDGHVVSRHVTNQMHSELDLLLFLDEESYKNQKNSVYNMKKNYNRHNKFLVTDLNELSVNPLSSFQTPELEMKNAKLFSALDVKNANLLKEVSQGKQSGLASMFEKIKTELYFHSDVKSPSQWNYFQQKHFQLIESIRPELATHQEYWRLLGYLALIATVVGIVAVIANEAHRYQTGDYLFFRTKSAKALDDYAADIDKLFKS